MKLEEIERFLKERKDYIDDYDDREFVTNVVPRLLDIIHAAKELCLADDKLPEETPLYREIMKLEIALMRLEVKDAK